MDMAGFGALVSSLLVNGMLAYRLLRKTNTEAGNAQSKRSHEDENHASEGWEKFADKLSHRLDSAEQKAQAAEEKAERASLREAKCQAAVAKLTEQNKQQGIRIVQLEQAFRALKIELRERGIRSDTGEFPTPPEFPQKET